MLAAILPVKPVGLTPYLDPLHLHDHYDGWEGDEHALVISCHRTECKPFLRLSLGEYSTALCQADSTQQDGRRAEPEGPCGHLDALQAQLLSHGLAHPST